MNYGTVRVGSAPSSKRRGSSVLKAEYFTSPAIVLEKTLEWLEEYDLSLAFTLHEVFIGETVDKKHLLVVSEYDKEEYDFNKKSFSSLSYSY